MIDVAEAFVGLCAAGCARELDIHIVDDVDVSMIESSSIDLVLAQSSWSHINLYDQYRYLRDLRRVLREGAPIVVSGLFQLGVAHDWTWNRFRRRVDQIDHGLGGVYHEFTSIGAVAEMLARLGYEDVTLSANAFTARRGRLTGDEHHQSLPAVRFRYRGGFADWLADGRSLAAALPPAHPDTAAPPKSSATARARLGRIRRSVTRRVNTARRTPRGDRPASRPSGISYQPVQPRVKSARSTRSNASSLPPTVQFTIRRPSDSKIALASA